VADASKQNPFEHRRAAGPCLVAVLAALAAASVRPATAAEDAGDRIPDGEVLLRVPAPSSHATRFGAGVTRDAAASTSSWWLAPTGVAVILCLCGAVCVGARKHGPRGTTTALKIIGRMSLSPRHSIVLVRAGERTLMIGLGPQAAPALLGELPRDAASDLDPESARPPGAVGGFLAGRREGAAGHSRRSGLDVRPGDEA
jgi:flagellar biogenesis protein FliO